MTKQADSPEPLRGLAAAIATLHDKTRYIQPALRDTLNWSVTTYTELDTDTLGTFSGEVERQQSPVACATAKAIAARQGAQCDIGIGSEGSFQSDAFGFATFNEEILVCVDSDDNPLAIGRAKQPVFVDQITWKLPLPSQWQQDVVAFLEELPPKQACIVAAGDANKRVIAAEKGLYTHTQIITALQQLSTHANATLLELQFDLRAMHCPQRQETLAAAAQDLAKRLTSKCPQCNHRGFVYDTPVSGLPCSQCLQPTAQTKAFSATCSQCNYSNQEPVAAEYTQPVNCNVCNP
ncbi:DUF6671 family protein [Alteromonas facilis]|uniref:DUF6671 family protein n=1 Tax=Alteromonas facilis TaxID=2048004 RepID=UPI000C28DF79|nr:DUF6671 family protein [Alteromonas facilis]